MSIEGARVSQKNMKIQKVYLHRLFRESYDPISLCMAKLNWFISHYLDSLFYTRDDEIQAFHTKLVLTLG